MISVCRGFLLGFVFSLLKREESESLRFLEAAGSHRPLTVIFSLGSDEVTYFSRVPFTPFPVSLKPSEGGVLPHRAHRIIGISTQEGAEPGPSRAAGAATADRLWRKGSGRRACARPDGALGSILNTFSSSCSGYILRRTADHQHVRLFPPGPVQPVWGICLFLL